jgi:hypothetical protein
LDFEGDIARIANRICYGQTREQIHDDLCLVAGHPDPGMMSEEMFFLAWHAAQMLVADASVP